MTVEEAQPLKRVREDEPLRKMHPAVAWGLALAAVVALIAVPNMWQSHRKAQFYENCALRWSWADGEARNVRATYAPVEAGGPTAAVPGGGPGSAVAFYVSAGRRWAVTVSGYEECYPEDTYFRGTFEDSQRYYAQLVTCHQQIEAGLGCLAPPPPLGVVTGIASK